MDIIDHFVHLDIEQAHLKPDGIQRIDQIIAAQDTAGLSSAQVLLKPGEFELIDEDQIIHKCKFISSDDDGNAICIIKSFTVLNLFFSLWFYDYRTAISWKYDIIEIFNDFQYISSEELINDDKISVIICKLKFICSDTNIPQQIFALLSYNSSISRPLWNINKNIILDPIYDFNLCYIPNDKFQLVQCILHKNIYIKDTFIIRLPYPDEYHLFKENIIYPIININISNLNPTNIPIFQKWLNLMKFNNYQFNIQESEIFDEPLNHEPITVNEELTVIEEPIVIEKPVIVKQEPEVIEEPVTVNEEQVTIIEEQVIIIEEQVTIIEEPVTIIEEPEVIEEPVTIIEEVKEELKEEVIDNFYENCIFTELKDTDIKVSSVAYVPSKNVKSDLKKNSKNKKSKSKKTKQNIKLDTAPVTDMKYIILLSKFEDFYTSIINNNKYDKQKINDCYYNNIIELQNNNSEIDDNEIFNIIKDNIKHNFPGLLFKNDNIEKKEDVILILKDNDSDGNTTDDNSSEDNNLNDIKLKEGDTIWVNNDDEADNLINRLKHKCNQRILLKHIGPFRKMFGDKLNYISQSKRKLILIYFTIYNQELIKFHCIFPKLLFQNNYGHVNNLLIKKENDITIFHVEYLYSLLKNYIYCHLDIDNKLYKNNKQVFTFVGKIIFQYISIFNTCDEHYEISIMKNNNFDHYVKILKFHIEFHYPNFDDTVVIDIDKIDFIKSDIDKYILSVRLIASQILSTVDINTSRYYFIKDAICKYIDRKFYNHQNDELNSDLDDDGSKVYDIEDIKLNLLNLIMVFNVPEIIMMPPDYYKQMRS
jgi:hypothetical protein